MGDGVGGAGGAGGAGFGSPTTVGGGAFFVGNGIACSAGGAGSGAVADFGCGGGAGLAQTSSGDGWNAMAKVMCFVADCGFGGGGGWGLGGGGGGWGLGGGAGGGAAFSGGDPPMAGAWFLEGVGGSFGGGDFAGGHAGSDPSGADTPAPMTNEKVHLLPLPCCTWWSGDLSSHSLRVPGSNKRFSSPIHFPVPWVRLLGSKLKTPSAA